MIAYLTVLFFDERFKFIGAEDGGAYQQQVAASVTEAGSNLQLLGLRAPKNGYCLVYVSNESDGHVYFDNLRVSHAAGNILEETHYYSFGLKIAAISSKKLGHVSEGVLKNGNGSSILNTTLTIIMYISVVFIFRIFFSNQFYIPN